MRIALAPMEGLMDEILRSLLTDIGGIDWCVTEFIRVSDRLLPAAAFYRQAPELLNGGCTTGGTPVHVQLLGSDPLCLAENAAAAVQLGAPVIDLNFGCPAKTVNRSQGGAVLLKYPDRLERIVGTVRRHVPADIPVTAKMRLGYDHPEDALDCAAAIQAGGAQQLVVHARTRKEGYRPPAHWEWIARLRETITIPLMANGDVWTVEDYHRCVRISGVEDVMLGRGIVCRPYLARQIAAWRDGAPPMADDWITILPLLQTFWNRTRAKLSPRYAPGRLKQWLSMLSRSYPEASALFDRLRRENDAHLIDELLQQVFLTESPPQNVGV